MTTNNGDDTQVPLRNLRSSRHVRFERSIEEALNQTLTEAKRDAAAAVEEMDRARPTSTTSQDTQASTTTTRSTTDPTSTLRHRLSQMMGRQGSAPGSHHEGADLQSVQNIGIGPPWDPSAAEATTHEVRIDCSACPIMSRFLLLAGRNPQEGVTVSELKDAARRLEPNGRATRTEALLARVEAALPAHSTNLDSDPNVLHFNLSPRIRETLGSVLFLTNADEFPPGHNDASARSTIARRTWAMVITML